MFNDHALILFTCFVGAIVWVLITKIFTYKKLLDEKNIQIIQHYLDGKFLYKNLVNSISMSNASEFCIQLIKDVKEYHNLEDVIVIDSIIMLSGENNTLLRSAL
jgi:archaellum biogenesis ATPase FlaH